MKFFGKQKHWKMLTRDKGCDLGPSAQHYFVCKFTEGSKMFIDELIDFVEPEAMERVS